MNAPITVETKLGWVTYGVNSAELSPNGRKAERAFAGFGMKRRVDEMEQLMKEHFANEDLGVLPLKLALNSQADERAVKIMNETTKFIGDRYEVGLLWRIDDIVLPHSEEVARRRFASIERKMLADEDFARLYQQKITDYIEKGYARKMTCDEVAVVGAKTFYLPHFAVVNPNKKGLRVVFDAAAVINGTSLNQQLLAGPDLNGSLLSILSKFRMEPVAVCGDIQEMFLQVAVAGEDQYAQRFLWRNVGSEQEIGTYVMKRMLFGATCSPTLAQHVKNYNAERFREEQPRAVQGVIDRHYVDDYVDCFESVQEAIEVLREVIRIQRAAGFELKGFMSNEPEVLKAIGSPAPERSIVDLQDASVERVLGMHWDTSRDEFIFVLKFHRVAEAIVDGRSKPTKREILRLVMSVFDPFGMLANVMITGKLIMQKLWKLGLQWDEPIADDMFTKWKSWLKDVRKAEYVRVPRCYAGSFNIDEAELHVFADASEDAMAAVAYWRNLFVRKLDAPLSNTCPYQGWSYKLP